MANATFSPQDFKVWLIEEATTGTAPTLTSGLSQLDVDSVSLPTLSPNQVLAPRTRTGRILNENDFFQDNEYRATEVSVSGVFHNDAACNLLMQSVMGQTLATTPVDLNLSYDSTGTGGDYGIAEGDKTFTMVIASPDAVDGYNTVLTGCLCTNFSISADMGTDGGQYKFSATVSTGKNPALTNEANEDGTKYGTSSIALSTLSAIKVANVTSPVLSAFNVTIDSPAVYTGTSGTGYASYTRGAEIAVTANATVKYDSLTRGLPNTFDTQTSAIASNALTLTQTTAQNCSIAMAKSVLTGVAFNAGDIMMLDVEMKGVAADSGNVISFDLAS